MSGTVMGAVGVAFLVALVLVPVLVRFAIGRDLLDVPNARSSHEVPTPRLGGLAVIAGVWAATPFISDTFLFLAAATLSGLVGVLDDFVDLPFWMKAAGQATVAFIALFLVTLVGTTGLDACLAVLAAAVAGFLVWNVSPARIFLGDSGSHFVGFFIGAVALYTEPVGGPGSPYGPYLAFLVAAAIFTPFLFDTAFTLVRRATARKNIFAAHREHVYQRITPHPASHRQVSIVYFALSALAGIAAVLASSGTLLLLLLGGVLIFGLCLFMAFLPRIAAGKGNV